ncbi:MAG: exodeoxyribonuclease VII large subunit, partial [Alphaproteobacteria bacterium]|nr:exodeoxyribonuclease VII large subunit [Alphaproteobacteria bacterium]
KGTVEENFNSLKIQGEVSGLKLHSSGHTYFSLKDNNSLINAICWRGTKISVALEEGMEIVAKGRVTTYPGRSTYQFIVEEANIAGEGAWLKIFNERKKLYESMGYFANKRPIPKFPQLIGIVTSKTGAVLHDMENRLKDRYPFCKVLVWSTNVQGTGAAEQIASAVRGFNFMTVKPDVLIVARGGGSIEDLWAFNEEVVVKAVFESKIPVISGVGHEPDWTLIDFAADLRAPTPTAAIEYATPVLAEVNLQVSDFGNRMGRSMLRIVQEQTVRLSSFSRYLSSSQNFIISIVQKFDDKADRFMSAMQNFLNSAKLSLKAKRLINPTSYINFKRQQYISLQRVFDKLATHYLLPYHDKLATFSIRLEQASFKKILSKGFCFITDNSGKIIETKKKLESIHNTNICIHFQDGTAQLYQQ